MRSYLAGVLLLAVASVDTAQASVITFNGVVTGLSAGSSYIEGGYNVTFNGDTSDSAFILASANCTPPCPDNGTSYLLDLSMNSVKLSRVDGQAFSLTGFDGGEASLGQTSTWSSFIRVTGSSAGSIDFGLDFVQDASGALNDFQAFVLPVAFQNQFSYTFSSVPRPGVIADGFYSIDNLSVTTVPVPEPASLTLFGLGLAGLAARRWRQRRNR